MNITKGEILHFDKPLGWTSFNLVAKVRWLICRKAGIKKLKVGHAGTLDPLATGVMTICVGRATRLISELQAHTKEYVATLQLGATTPSFDLEKGEITVDPEETAYAYRTKLKNATQGIASSVAAYGDYAYFGDMAGSIQCVDMNPLQCVWAVDMDDSVVASVSLECGENGEVYLYAGNVVNKRARSSAIRLVKIDALTGEILWECQTENEIKGKYASANAKNGIYAGLMGSPLVGEGDISDLVIFNVNQVIDGKTAYAVVYALDKETGAEVWSQPLDISSISSPVAVYQPDGKSYIVLGDDNGTLLLMDGFTGLTLNTVNLGSAIQASPAVYGNKIVVGTTGGMVYFVSIN